MMPETDSNRSVGFSPDKPPGRMLAWAKAHATEISGRDRVRKRQGFALLAVMCCLIAVSFLVVNWLKAASFERERLRSAERRLQADWLAEAAIERAAAKLAKNESYSGETWKIAAADLGGADAAAVEIKVTSNSNRAVERTIKVSADFPVEALHRVRSTREIVVDIALVKHKHSG